MMGRRKGWWGLGVGVAVGAGGGSCARVRPVVPELPKIQVEAPATVKAGPYAMRFAPGGVTARRTGGGLFYDLADIYVFGSFELVRPPGPTVPVQMKLTPEVVPGGFDNGTSMATPSDPMPDRRDTFSFDALVPVGWRGKKLEVAGEMVEQATKVYTARFSNVRLVPLAGAPVDGERPPNYGVIVPETGTAFLEDGVVVKLNAQREAKAALSVTVLWDNKRVLPRLAKENSTVSVVRSNVGKVNYFRSDDGDHGASAQAYTLRYDPAADAGAKTVRLEVEFSKPARSYPFRLPLRFTWTEPKGSR